MELALGGSLSSFLKERYSCKTKVNDIEASTIIKNILLPISFLHRKNIIHRDIKPGNYLHYLANILIMKPNNLNTLKLTDFGLSVQLKGKNFRNLLFDKCGTLLYMAPECLNDTLYSKVY